MVNKKVVFKSTLGASFLLSLLYFIMIFFSQFITNIMFINEPIYFVGENIPFSNVNVKVADNIPNTAKAVMVYNREKKNIEVVFPKNAEYLFDLKSEIQNISYEVSKHEGYVVKNYYDTKKTVNMPNFQSMSTLFVHIVSFIIIFIFGLIYNPFEYNKYVLVYFGYFKQLIMPIIYFSAFALLVYLLPMIPYFKVPNTFIPFLTGLAVVFLCPFIKNIFYKLGIMLAGLLLIIFAPPWAVIYAVFILSMFTNLFINTIKIKKEKFFN